MRGGGRIKVALVAAVMCAAFVGAAGPFTARAAEGDLRRIGDFPQPPAANRAPGAAGGKIIAIDAEARRLYYRYYDPRRGDDFFLREYDLRTRIPRLVREAKIFDGEILQAPTLLSPYTVGLDRVRRRLYILNTSSGRPGVPYTIEVVDLKTFKAQPPIDLARAAPGLIPYGMTYSRDDDRLYLVGQVNVYPLNYALNFHGTTPPPVSAAAAIDPNTGGLSWLRIVPQCQAPMTTYAIGSLVARSERSQALYFACIRQSVYPGESGVVRLWISPEADMTAAQGFKIEFFPVSGLYTGGDGIVGVAAFDAVSDRFYMQSVSQTTPGSWVFDGRLSGWVGFVGAPDYDDHFVGLDEGTGRLYMGGLGDPQHNHDAYIVVADGRTTPVPQGNAYFLTGLMQDAIHADPLSRRLFVTVQRRGKPHFDILILEDRSHLARAPVPLDYDALTDDVDEGPSTSATYAGTIGGYGSHVLLAGGYGGSLSVCGASLDSAICPAGLLAVYTTIADPLGIEAPVPLGADNTIAGFKPGDRGLYMARAPLIDVRNVGASASAQALMPDSLTADEYETRFREPLSEGTGETAAQVSKETGEQLQRDIHDRLIWPHRSVACLDGGGSPQRDDQSGAGGSSAISCDLKAQEARATSRFSGFDGGVVSIASSFVEARAYRDAKGGSITEATAIAKGIDIQGAVGSVAIAEVRATSRTAAHGRPKTAEVTWERLLSGVVVRDASGGVTYRCGDADSCDPRAAVNAMNEVLGTRIQVTLPNPERDATPKGAFAGVRRTDADYYNALTVNNDNSRVAPALEIVVLNDSVEKSRLVVQLAGIEASSIYGISSLPGEGGLGPGPGGILPPLPQPSFGPLPPLLPPTVTTPPSAETTRRFLRAALFFFRSPKDAFLVGLLGLLFLGAGAAAWRRHTLMTNLTE